jgi:hypothetical protein
MEGLICGRSILFRRSAHMGLLVLSRRSRIVQRRYQMHRREARSAAVEESDRGWWKEIYGDWCLP